MVADYHKTAEAVHTFVEVDSERGMNSDSAVAEQGNLRILVHSFPVNLLGPDSYSEVAEEVVDTDSGLGSSRMTAILDSLKNPADRVDTADLLEAVEDLIAERLHQPHSD